MMGISSCVGSLRIAVGLMVVAAWSLPLLAAAAGSTDVATFAEHRLEVTVDTAAGRLEARDTLRPPAPAAARGVVVLRLHASFELEVEQGGHAPVRGETGADGLVGHRIALWPGSAELVLRYHGPLPGAAQGIDLGPSSGWYPLLQDAVPSRPAEPVRYALRLRLPDGWSWIATGAPEEDTLSVPVPGIALLAGPYVNYAGTAGRTALGVALLAADPGLARRYLDAASHYLPLYASLLGDYPFPRFTVVENAAPTGLGFPGYTLLGGRVMRLPFIPHTSLPHEILHSWWGNGVYVDATDGNWSEGLTTYLADHAIRERRDAGGAYRRDALARYRMAHVASRLRPLREFRARHDRHSQTLGYDRAMMVFHMIRSELGAAGFLERLRALYRDGRFQRRSASQVLATLHSDPAWFDHWWQRADAPRLALQCCEVVSESGTTLLRGVLMQTQPGAAFPLRVPLAVSVAGEAEARVHRVAMHEHRHRFSLSVPGGVEALAVDPDHDLMRLADLDELPAAVAEVLSAPGLVALAGSAAALPAPAAAMAQGLGARIVAAGTAPGPGVTAALIFADAPAALQAVGTVPPALRERGDHVVHVVRVDGVPGAPDLRSVMHVRLGPQAGIDTVARLARVLPRYGRYTELAFSGPRARLVHRAQQDPPLHTHPLVWRRSPDARSLPRPALPSLLGAPHS
jgi:hypothetical protein